MTQNEDTDFIDAEFNADDIDAEFNADDNAEGGEHALVPLRTRREHVHARLAPLELGYYRARSADKHFNIGDRVYLLSALPKEVSFVRHASTYRATPESFRAQFEWFPEGQEDYQREMADLMAFARGVSQKAKETAQGLKAFSPHVGAKGELEGTEDLEAKSEDTSLVVSHTPKDAKVQLARTQQSVAKAGETMGEIQARLKSLAEEQAIILKAEMEGLTELVRNANEAIWTINLYIGQDEEVVTLRTGEAAPAETPITLRQLVLFMDEECAAQAEHGGIDVRSIEQFDAWLTASEENLNQVFPEQKGVVCLKPRRFPRDYQDPWMNNAMREANSATYFLIRNGENVYRMNTLFDVGRTMLPRDSEFLEMFQAKKGQFLGGVYFQEDTVLTPGTKAYMEAEKKSDARGRHYFRMALILQGLIDRTPIFHPLADNVRVTDPASHGRSVLFINDAERALGDGHEPFSDWLARINAQIEPGCRVVGYWSGIERDEESRISPKGARYPDDRAIHTIEERRQGGFVFFYDRNYSTDREVDRYKARASFLVYAHDDHLLNVDAASEEDIRYYLTNRLARWEYTRMFPMFEAALEVKRREEAEETPFRQLLVGEMMKVGADHADAESQVLDLVRWFKFKNRTHRSLTSEDAKAVRMIVDEYRLRAKQVKVRALLRANGQHEELVRQVLSLHPDALMIAHKAENEYTFLTPENGENVFVTEHIWNVKSKRAVSEPWKTVDRRFERWEVLHTSDRWAGWKFNASFYEHATDPERQRLAEAALQQVPKDGLVLAVTWGDRADANRVIVFFLEAKMLRPPVTVNLLTGRQDRGYSQVFTAKWKRNAVRNVELGEGELTSRSFGLKEAPWDVNYNKFGHGNAALLRLFPEAIEEWRSLDAQFAHVRAEEQRLREVLRTFEKQIEMALSEARERATWEKFMAEYGDPSLWDGFKKTLKPVPVAVGDLGHVLAVLLERGYDLSGLSVPQVVALYQTLPNLPRIPRHGFYGYEHSPAPVLEIPEEVLALPLTLNAQAGV